MHIYIYITYIYIDVCVIFHDETDCYVVGW
jgi:hypothetical protein